MIARIQVRRDTTANWELHNPPLRLGEIGLDITNNKFKVGGESDSEGNFPKWNDLNYELGQWQGHTRTVQIGDSQVDIHDIKYGFQDDEGDVYINNDLFVNKDVKIEGNLTVRGDTTTVNTVNSTFKDNIIELNLDIDDTGNYNENLESGIQVNRGILDGDTESSFQRIYWQENDLKWVIDADLNVLGDLYSNGTKLWSINSFSDIWFNGTVGIGDFDQTDALDSLHILNTVEDSNPGVRIQNDEQTWAIYTRGSDSDKLKFVDISSTELGTTPFQIETNAPNNSLYIQGGTESTGYVGIGTSSPDVPLHIYKNHTSGTGEWLNIGFDDINPKKIEMGSSSYNAYMSLYGASGVENVKLNSSGDSYFMGGKVGIGTTNPLSQLSVNIDEDNSSVTDLRTINGIDVYNHDNSVGSKSAMLFKTPGSAIGWVGERISGDSMNLHLTTESNLGLTDADGNPESLGIPKVTFTNSGTVGIGTTTPNSVFEIVRGNPILTIRDTDTSVETVNAKLRLAESNPGDAVGNYWDIEYLISDLNFSYNGSPFMHIDYQGKVGIGTTSPEAKLTVDKTGQIGFIIQEEDSNEDVYRVHMMSSNSNDGYYIGYAANGVEGYKLNSNGDSYLMGGKVGIGTESPDQDVFGDAEKVLHMKSSNVATLRLESTHSAGSDFEISAGNSLRNVYMWNKSNGGILFATNNSEAMRITSDGNVGIGTTPLYELHVKKDQNARTNLVLQNHDTGTSADAQIFVETKPGGGDPQIHFQIDGVESYTVGIDNSDGDKFKISDYGSLGTNDRLTIDSSGYVGIGTDGPSSKLHVNGSSGVFAKITDSASTGTVETGLILERSAANTDYRVLNDGTFRVQTATDASTWTDIMTITDEGHVDFLGDVTSNGVQVGVWTPGTGENSNDIYYNTGNVGIGHTSPQTKLDVVGNISSTTTKKYYVDSGAGVEYIYVGKLRNSGSTDGYANIVVYNCVDHGQPNHSKLEVQVNQRGGLFTGNAILYGSRSFPSGVDNNVDVICCGENLEPSSTWNDPNVPEYQDIFVYIKFNDYVSGVVEVTHRNGLGWQKEQNSIGSTLPSGKVTIFDSSENIDFTVSDDGNVGINTSTPSTKLNIQSNTTIGNETLLRLQRPNGHGNSGFNQYYNSAAGSDPVLWGLNFGLEVSSDTDGKVGIKFESTSGTTTTSDKIIFRTANTNQVDIDNSGNLTATGNITSTSDITLKENIELISDPIEKVKELGGYTFNKKGEDLRMVGLIAQEVEKVLPEAVHENQEGIKSLAYGNMVALLVECIKKQDERIETLEKTIEKLKL